MATGSQPAGPMKTGEPERMLEACKTARERALVVLLWRGGLRVSEACALVGTDVELKEDRTSILRIRHGKGNRQRYLHMDTLSTTYLRPVMDGGRPLLITRKGTAMFHTHARVVLRRAAKLAGIPDRVHPHALRHTCARNLHDEGFSVREIQVWLGHSRLNTTEEYLSSIGCHEVAEKAKGRTW